MKRQCKKQCCPNCSCNYRLNPFQALDFREEGIITYQVLICTECLKNPDCLDENRIGQSLLERGWPKEEIALVKQAVIDRKNKHRILKEANSLVKVGAS